MNNAFDCHGYFEFMWFESIRMYLFWIFGLDTNKSYSVYSYYENTLTSKDIYNKNLQNLIFILPHGLKMPVSKILVFNSPMHD